MLFRSCNIQVSGINFTGSLNNGKGSVDIISPNKLEFIVGEKTDYFSDPNKIDIKNNAPILLSKLDISKPFTFTTKVTPEFTKNGTYNAGVVYIYNNDNLYQKLCFEQDERGNHRVVTVRTVNTSDDNNHEIITQPYIYLKISSDGKKIGSYYSLDNNTWYMVRLYENTYPSETWLGISSQSPLGEGCKTIFEDLNFEQKSIQNFRLGI